MQNQHAYMNNHGGCILMFSYGGWLLSPPFSGIGAMHKNHLRQKICIYKTLRVTLNWSTMTKVPHHNYAGHSGSCYFVLHSSGVVTRLLWSWVCCHRQRGRRSQSQLSKRRRPEDTSNSFANVWSLFSKFGQADAKAFFYWPRNSLTGGNRSHTTSPSFYIAFALFFFACFEVGFVVTGREGIGGRASWARGADKKCGV